MVTENIAITNQKKTKKKTEPKIFKNVFKKLNELGSVFVTNKKNEQKKRTAH